MAKKILIAVPCMDSVSARFAQSLAMLQKVEQTSVCFEIGSLVYMSRNRLATIAVKGGFDYVMWFDSDVMFAPNTLSRLMADDKDIVSGLYFRRAAPYTPVFFDTVEGDTDTGLRWTERDDYPETLFEAAGVGFGCVLMKTDVLLEMLAVYGDYFTPIGNSGEDLSFCWRAKELGYKIYVDPAVKLGHESKAMITEEFYRAYKGGQNES